MSAIMTREEQVRRDMEVAASERASGHGECPVDEDVNGALALFRVPLRPRVRPRVKYSLGKRIRRRARDLKAGD